MKEVLVFGDMTSDRTAEQYPTVALCDACIEAEIAKEEDSQIVSVSDVEADGPCEWCDEEH